MLPKLEVRKETEAGKAGKESWLEKARIEPTALALQTLPFGPWKIVYSGEWLGFKTSVFENSEHVLLLVAFDKTGGALVLMKKVFLLEGNDVELLNFLNSQKRVLTIIEKTSKIGRFKYLLLETDPAYSTSIIHELPALLRAQKSFLDAVGKALEEIAKTYGAKATDFAHAPTQAIELFLGDPFQALALKPSTATITATRALETRKQTFEEPRATIGINANRELVQLSIRALRKSMIIGETREKQLHLMHLLAEAALENNVSCFILATTNAWNGLSDANPDKSLYETFHLSTQPHGYPLKKFAQGEGLYVNLKKIDALNFTQSFALYEEAGETISKAFNNATTLDDLITNVKTLSEKESPTTAKSKALRVLHLIRKEAPLLFGEDKLKRLENAFARAREKNIATANVIGLSNETRAVRELVARSIVAGLSEALGESEVGSLDALVLVEDDYSKLSVGLKKELIKLADAGIGAGVVFRASHAADALEFPQTSLFELVGAEVVLTEGSVKTRFAPRPAFSKCSEFQQVLPQVLQPVRAMQAQAQQARQGQQGLEGLVARVEKESVEKKKGVELVGGKRVEGEAVEGKREKPLPFSAFFKRRA